MKIRVIIAITATEFRDEVRREFEDCAAAGTEIEIAQVARGPASIECRYDEAIAAPEVLDKAREAEAEGCDAVIVNCFVDVGVGAAREIVDIPVIGPGATAMMFAALLSNRFSVVTVLPNLAPMISDIARISGTGNKLASVRSVNIPVMALTDKDKLKQAIYDETLAAINEDKAEAIVLGCTGMRGTAPELMRRLKESGHDIPVVDPTAASLKFAEALVSMGIRPSRISYMPPPPKERRR